MPEIPEIIKHFRKRNQGKTIKRLVELYYEFMGKIHEAKKQKDNRELTIHAMLSLPLIEPLIISTTTEGGKFGIRKIPALEELIKIHKWNKNKGQLLNLKEIIYFYPELIPWRKNIDKALDYLAREER